MARYRENPMALGSRGQEVKHPALEQYLAIHARALVLAESLLLTPRSRKRAGVDDTGDETPFDFLDEGSADASDRRKRNDPAAGTGGRVARLRTLKSGLVRRGRV